MECQSTGLMNDHMNDDLPMLKPGAEAGDEIGCHAELAVSLTA